MRTDFFIVIIFEPITDKFFGLYILIDVPEPRA